MSLHNLATLLPPLAPGEPPSRDAAKLRPPQRTALISASLGYLRRAGSHWYGPDKTAPIHGRTVASLKAAGLLYSPTPNIAHITRTRGGWCARTLCSEILSPPIQPAITRGLTDATARKLRKTTEVHACA